MLVQISKIFCRCLFHSYTGMSHTDWVTCISWVTRFLLVSLFVNVLLFMVLIHYLFIPVNLVQFILLLLFLFQTSCSSLYNIWNCCWWVEEINYCTLKNCSFHAKTHLYSPMISLVGNCVPTSQFFQPRTPKGLYCSLRTVHDTVNINVSKE